ncbi:MAG: glycine zipper 2TM domain-containing protein [Steroidobacteraceae bacterium]
MNAMLKSIVRSTILGLGLVGTSVALAHPPHWVNSRWQREEAYEPVYVVRAPVNEFDYARVVDVDPIVRRVAVESPQRDCWYEDQQVYGQPRSATPTILGAIIGGVVGHQFGSGHSRNVGTVAGAVLGASVGHDVSARNAGVETRSVQRCEVRGYQAWEERIDGYRVTYVYHGREYRTVMPYDPGDRVQVRVGMDVDVVR